MERLRRLITYFREMFPLHVNGVGAVLMFYSFLLLAQATGGGAIELDLGQLYGLATLFLSLLLLRNLDELKDQDVDSEVFPDRPLVTGAVKYSDVRLLALLCILALIPLNVGRGPATSLFLIYFAGIVLAWQWWLFPERVSNNLFLTFITHQPLVPLMYLYVYGVHLDTSGDTAQPLVAAAAIAVYWLPMFAWEIARKVRAPEEETDYVTYTMRWGTRRAAMVPLAAILLAGAGMLGIGLHFGLSVWFLAVHGVAAVLLSLPILRFIQRPEAATNRVRTAVEGYTIVFHGATVVLMLVRGGIL